MPLPEPVVPDGAGIVDRLPLPEGAELPALSCVRARGAGRRVVVEPGALVALPGVVALRPAALLVPPVGDSGSSGVGRGRRGGGYVVLPGAVLSLPVAVLPVPGALVPVAGAVLPLA